MANGWNSERDREATLRRVAIVLSSLPAPVASQLLGSIGAESKQAVRRTMTTLADVDPLERQRALQAFKVSVEQQPHQAARPSQSPLQGDDRLEQQTPGPSASRIVSRRAQNRHTPAAGSDFTPQNTSATTHHSTDESPLQFLDDVDDDALVNLLAVEHPQTVALVLASIAPAQAARILPRLEPSLQRDALSRIGRLGDIPEAAAAEVAEHFRNSLARQTNDDHGTSGRRALNAILAAMPSPPAFKHPIPAPQAAPATPHDPEPQHSPQPTSPVRETIAPVSFPSADIPAIDLTHKLRIAEESTPETDPQHGAGATTAPAAGSPPQSSASETPQAERARAVSESRADDSDHGTSRFDSTDAIHQHLLGLQPIELCQALGKVETRVAMLALCGLPNEVTESALAVLPRAHAKKVRIKMNALGSLHLREIDDAKEKVARVSLAAGGPTSNPVPVAA